MGIRGLVRRAGPLFSLGLPGLSVRLVLLGRLVLLVLLVLLARLGPLARRG